MRILEEFIQLELDEGKKLNAALALSTALTVPFALQSSEDRAAQRQHPHAQVAKQSPVDSKPEPIDIESEDDASTATSSATYTRKELMAFVQQASERAGISPAFVDAIIRTETNYHYQKDDPKATSSAGAQGIMQFMPATAERFGLKDPYDPKKAIPAGVQYLKFLLDRYDGDYELAAAGYNSGEGNVDKYDGIPPFDETQRYVPKVMEYMASSPFAERADE